MYLVGTFTRDYYEHMSNDEPMSSVFLKENITRDHLRNAAEQEDYQVINLDERTYFDPKKNAWVKLNKG